MTHDTALPVFRQRPPVSARTVCAPLPGAPPDPARSLYIHVPFCFHKCHYCDFYSIVDTQDRQDAFTRRLIRELAALAPLAGGLPLRTIFVGGGTPSLLRVDLWRPLLMALGDCFDLSEIRAGRGEFTVECNPETVSAELMKTLRNGGVDRVSIGAQSFNPTHLKTLERWHNPDNVGRAVEMARAAGIPRQSLDLIYAIPGQTMADWDRDLRTAISMGTSHLSCYSLTYEPATAMTARLKRGEFTPIDEDLDADMHERTLLTLRAAGLDRYEVSNFAAPGAESRHNLAYWRQEAWLAAGPSASGHVFGNRWKNAPRLDDYLSFDDDGFAPAIDVERYEPLRALSERIMTGIRLSEGLDWGRLLHDAESASPGKSECLARVRSRLESDALAKASESPPSRLILSDAGFMIADRIALDLILALDAA